MSPCLRADARPKMRFRTEADALAYLNARPESLANAAYPCHACGWWHTSKATPQFSVQAASGSLAAAGDAGRPHIPRPVSRRNPLTA